MISFMLCYVSWTSLIRLKIYINSTYEYQINEEAFYIKQYVIRIISAKGKPLDNLSNKLPLALKPNAFVTHTIGS